MKNKKKKMVMMMMMMMVGAGMTVETPMVEIDDGMLHRFLTCFEGGGVFCRYV